MLVGNHTIGNEPRRPARKWRAQGLMMASQMVAVANEGESEKAKRCLERAKHNTEDAKRDIRELLLESLKRLFMITARLFDASQAAAGTIVGKWNSVFANNNGGGGSVDVVAARTRHASKYRFPRLDSKPM